MTTYSATKGDGIAWACAARAAGLKISATGTVVRLTATFPAGDAAAYAMTENKILGHLYAAPATGAGSVWGGTSDGIGGALALDAGTITIKRSGISKRFVGGLS